MSSSIFAKRSAVNGDAEEKKNDVIGGVAADADDSLSAAMLDAPVDDSSPSRDLATDHSFEATRSESGNIHVAAAAAEEEDDEGEATSMTSASDFGDACADAVQGEDSNNAMNASGMSDDNDVACPLWSAALSTPSDSPAAFTPAVENAATSNSKQNLHGLGLKYAVDRTRVLSRTGKGCSALLFEIATLHDELVKELNKLCPSALEQAANGTPMEEFAKDVAACISSFVAQTQNLGSCVRNDVANSYRDNSHKLTKEGRHQYGVYVHARGKCASARREALKLRKRYVDQAKEVENAIAALRKARMNKSKRRRTTADGLFCSTDSTSNDDEGKESQEGDPPVEVRASFSSWEEELRRFGEKAGLVGKCEAVVRASEEMGNAEAKYSVAVAEENASVDEAQDAERRALDAVQRLEEERIVFLIGLLDRFLQDEKESLENMSLDLSSVEPLDLADENHRQEPSASVSSLSTTTSTTPSLFSPRRRAQSDDGPAINETRLLNLPDNIAAIRDNMKGLIGRQLARLKTLKQVAAFNEGMASAIESFAEGLKSQLESSSSTAALSKNEGANVLGSWNSAIGSLVAHASCADALAKQIRKGNLTLQQTLLQLAEKEARTFQEKEEYRWKSLCDAARVEAKAKSKHRQCAAELEKARARLTSVEGEGSEDAAGEGDNANGGGGGANLSPLKTTKMDRHMNKAMGRMFAILPGGGEDVMNKVLTSQQRQAIVNRQLDEALAKEEKGMESFEVARSVRQQAVASYETEAEASEFKSKTDERNEWNEMQNSLVRCVAAMREFREGLLGSVTLSIETVRERHLGSKALGDVARWTAFTEGRLKDQRARNVDAEDSKEEEGRSGESGFCLKVQLVESTNVKDLIRSFLDEKDVVVDDPTDIGNGEDPAADSPREIGDGDAVVVKETPAPAPEPLPDVPPDPWIEKMDSIFSKKLRNVTIDRYHGAAWSEDTPLYGPWLERKGSFEVSVTDWECASPEDGEGFVNAWSKEKFAQRRIIKFKFKRTTHLYIGPPVAGVTQTQYLMKDGNDRCVVMMTVEMDGIPYSDSFAVEVRWSARRVEQNDIAVDAGVFVRFTKSNMFASKIKSGTLKETAPIHLDLFEVIKKAIASGEEDEGMEDVEVQPEEETKATTADEEANVTVAEAKEEAETVTTVEIPPQTEGRFHQLVAAFSSLTQSQQLLLGFVVFYFLTKMVIPRKDPTADRVDDLARKVESLTDEVREMKAMVESILKLSERNLSTGTSCNDSSGAEFAQE